MTFDERYPLMEENLQCNITNDEETNFKGQQLLEKEHFQWKYKNKTVPQNLRKTACEGGQLWWETPSMMTTFKVQQTFGKVRRMTLPVTYHYKRKQKVEDQASEVKYS